MALGLAAVICLAAGRAPSVASFSGDCAARSTGTAAARHDRRLPPRSRSAIDSLVWSARAALADRRPGRRAEVAMAMANFGLMYQGVGDLKRARTWVDSAATLARGTGDSERVAAVRLLHGEVYQSLGLSEVALADYATLRSGSVPLPQGMPARLHGDLAMAFAETGALDSALIFAQSAVRLRDAAYDTAGGALALNNLAQVVQVLGRVDSARALLCSALQRARQAGDDATAATVLNNIGYAYELEGASGRSLPYYGAALQAVLEAGDSARLGLTLINLGRAHLALAAPAAARDDLALALGAMQALGDSARLTWAQRDLGRAELALAREQAARGGPEASLLERSGFGHLREARRGMHEATRDRAREADVLLVLALAYRGRGGRADLDTALAYFDSASVLRGSVGRRVLADEDRVGFAEQQTDLTPAWVEAILARGAQGGAAAPAERSARSALAAAERGRARALLELVQSGRGPARAPPGGALDADTVPGVNLAARADSLLAPLAASRTAVLSYLVTDSAVVTWLALPDGTLEVERRPVARARLETLATWLRAQWWVTRTFEAPPVRADSALAELLFPTSLRRMRPGDELLIVPHDVLNLVSFAALPIGRSGETLGARFALRYAPSLALLAAVERGDTTGAAGRVARARRQPLLLGDPAMPEDPDAPPGQHFARLAGARAEVSWLASALGAGPPLVDTLATKAALLARLPGATLVHLATHGRAYGSAAAARRSFVVVAPQGGDDGRLTVAELLDRAGSLHLDAELLVLSACETARGAITRSEGTVGLQRAFLALGARTLLVTQWEVPSSATTRLVELFYSYWLDPRHPVSKAQALRLAQDSLRRTRRSEAERAAVPGDSTYSAPLYWAAFQLVGAN